MSHPLQSWDIFLEGRERRKDNAFDLSSIENLMDKFRWEQNSYDAIGNRLVWEGAIILITDAKLSILHATQNMGRLNGYKLQEVIGKTPKMFQGEKTEPEVRKSIRLALEKTQGFDVAITNYRKDGSLYRCNIQAHPLFNKNRELVNFVAFERELSC
jgi:PAS domain S-box-containing protein